MKKPTLLIILDGYGHSDQTEYNAVYHASKPNLDTWFAHYPHILLKASGTAVGLCDGVVGNSEVGHITIGCGRVIPQPLLLVQQAIDNKTFFRNPLLIEKLELLRRSGKTVHIMGLTSNGNVHSTINHLIAYIDAAQDHGVQKIVIHPFLDGRDTPPKSAATYLELLDNHICKNNSVTIGSLHGRFYAMDRDNNWERTQASYHVLTQPGTGPATTWQSVLEHNYQQGITDEFILPTHLDPSAYIRNGDGIIFFNCRQDRARQLTAAFVDPTFDYFPTQSLDLTFFITPTEYAQSLKTDVLFPSTPARHTLKEALSAAGKTIFSIAETEKYAHVTYFFADGKEEPFPTETRVLIPSIPAKNYIAIPEMSAKKITDTVIESLQNDPKDFYVINYANADMVGHSGDFQATAKAVECLDTQLKKLYDVVITKLDGTMYVTADHGNAECKLDQATGQPHTAHTTNPVPFLVIQKEIEGKKLKLPLTQLADIAPYILQQMGLKIPEEMD